MLRSDLDNHPLWTTISEIEGLLDSLTEQPGDAEVAPIARIRAYLANVRSMHELAAENAFHVSQTMVDQVLAPINQVLNQVRSRINFGMGGGQLEAAATLMEDTLLPLGTWPRPFAQGGQVRQMRTLIEDLLEQQRRGIEEIQRAHDAVLDSAAGVIQGANERRAEVIAAIDALRADAAAIARSVDDQKVRIDEVVQDGLKTIETVRERDVETITKFREEETARFSETFQPYRAELEAALKSATDEIAKFREQHKQFENMSSAAASETMAGKFRSEARWGRLAGILLYLLGFAAIVVAAVPFLALLADAKLDAAGEVEWGRIVVRIALGALLGSAAAVVIRLGGRFLTQATAAKRMELELRTFEPFLANVEKREAVDQARLEIVDRSFGRAYEVAAAADAKQPSKDADAVDLSTLERVTDLVSKILTRQ